MNSFCGGKIPISMILASTTAMSLMVSCIQTTSTDVISILLAICDGFGAMIAFQCTMPRPRRSLVFAIIIQVNALVWILFAFQMTFRTFTWLDYIHGIVRYFLSVGHAVVGILVAYEDIRVLSYSGFSSIRTLLSWLGFGVTATTARSTGRYQISMFDSIILLPPMGFPTANSLTFISAFAWIVFHVHMSVRVAALSVWTQVLCRLLLAWMVMFIVLMANLIPSRTKQLTTTWGSTYLNTVTLRETLHYIYKCIHMWFKTIGRSCRTTTTTTAMPCHIVGKLAIWCFACLVTMASIFICNGLIELLTKQPLDDSLIRVTVGAMCSLGIINLDVIYWVFRITFDM